MAFEKRLILVTTLFVLALQPVIHAQDGPKTKWINGHKYLLHKVSPKETWSSVSRKYDIPVEQLQKANPGVSVLKISQIIQVPADGRADAQTGVPPQTQVKETQPQPVKPAQKQTVALKKYHTVAKGETLYRISKLNNISVDELKALNNQRDNNVSVGQKLIVSNGTAVTKNEDIREPLPVTSPVTETVKETTAAETHDAPVVKTEVKTEVKHETKPVKEDAAPVTSVPVPPSSSEPAVTGEAPKIVTSNDKIVENGVATWMADTELNQNKFYALHHSAPIGTIIKVTNRMNNNSVYVKVVGVLPATGGNENVLIKITQAAAQRIGALDQRFQAELTYGTAKQ